MIHPSLAWIDDALDLLQGQTLRRRLSVRNSPQRPASIELDGQTLVNFSSNDYLGLAAEGLSRAVVDTLRHSGWGSGASPLVTGRSQYHAQLERNLAQFEETEAALLFPSGFAANVGAITALAGKSDVIYSDARNHASIIDGCRLSGARVEIYRHADAEHLAELLRSDSTARRRLIVTDSLFSMDGDFAPLVELVELAERNHAMLLVDEAHATGVFGAGGRGVCEMLGIDKRVPVRVGTLSKALGSIGGFVVGCDSLIQWLANRARTYVFSTSPPDAIAAAGLEALRLVRAEPWRRERLLEGARWLREQLGAQGWNLGHSQSQIVPIILGDAARTMDFAGRLRQRGLLVPGIRPPSVPQDQSLLRISLSYAHDQPALEQLLAALDGLR